jgi:hypothetical protein
MNPSTPGSTIGELLTELRDESSELLRQEVALAKAELGEAARQVGRNSVAIAKGGAIAYAGAIVLLIGIGALAGRGLAAAGVPEAFALWLGFVLVGAVTAVIGWTLLARAKRALQPGNLVPRETLASLRENRRWASEKIHHARHEPAT